MSVVEASAVVDASPERVWTVVADPRNLPRWDRHITRVDGVPTGGLEAGSTYRTEVRLMGVRATAEASVLQMREGAYSKIRLRGVVDAVVETWLDPLPGDRTRLRHRIEYRFPGGALGEIAGRTVGALGAKALLRRGVEAQKRQVEREAA